MIYTIVETNNVCAIFCAIQNDKAIQFAIRRLKTQVEGYLPKPLSTNGFCNVI
jgi:hypothetical protein